jgi:hypothetical protein
MIALVFEAYGALCLFALATFVVLAALAKLRPDLDEEELDFADLEKLKKLVNPEPSDDALSIEPPIIEEPSWSPWMDPPGKVEQASAPTGSAPVPYPQASHDLVLRFRPGTRTSGDELWAHASALRPNTAKS